MNEIMKNPITMIFGVVLILAGIFFWGNDIKQKPMDYLLVDTSPSLPEDRFTAIKDNIDKIIEKYGQDRELTIIGLSDDASGQSKKVVITVNPTANTGAAQKKAIDTAKQTWQKKRTQFFQVQSKSSSPIYETLEDIVLDTLYDQQESRIFIISDMVQISKKIDLTSGKPTNGVFASMFSKLPQGRDRIFLMNLPYDFVQNNDSTSTQRNRACETFIKELGANKPLTICGSWREFNEHITED